MNDPLLEVALSYFSTGQPVIAVRPNKKPYRRGWNKYFSQKQTEEEVREQFSNGVYGIARVNFPACAYLALDYDGEHAKEAWAATRITLPPTARISTPSGGEHLVFRQSRKLVEAAIVKRNIGIVVANCNCLKNGEPHPCQVDLLVNGYEIVSPTPGYVEDADCPLESAAEVPDEVVSLAIENQDKGKDRGNNGDDDEGKFRAGYRNAGLTSVAGVLRHQGLGFDDIFAELLRENKDRCEPPLDEDEVRRIAKSICRYAPGDREILRPLLNAADRNLERIAGQTLRVLAAANEPPFLFRHAENVSRVQRADSGDMVLRTVSEDGLRGVLARVAHWYEPRGKKKAPVPELPPRHVVKDILSMPAPPFPVVTRVVHAPIFAADGSLITAPGYSAAAKVFYDPAPGFTVAPVPDDPTPEEIAMALDVVAEVLGDFPFTTDAERAHATALMLQHFARELVEGATPLYLIEKPAPGTGATLLADVLSFSASGRRVPVLTEATDEADWRKRITATLLDGTSIVLIDNVRRRLESSALSSAITSATWKDRILGHSQMASIPVRCAWLATGNNPALSNEIARRTIRIRLDSKTAQPWLRTEFRHPNLRAWVSEQRSEIVHAALVLVRAWIAKGRPSFERVVFGMFESWSKVMGGILEVAGVEGFLSNLTEFYEESDAESAAWQLFIDKWWDTHRDSEVGVTELYKIIVPEKGDPLDISLGRGNEHSQKVRLGVALRQMHDRLFGDKRIVKGGEKARAQQWKLEAAETPNTHCEDE